MKIYKEIRYLFEALIVKIGIWIFGTLPYKTASNLAAKIAIFIGHKISVNHLASDNISNALPDYNKSQREKIVHEMWDNLGRIIGEYPHIAKMNDCEFKKIISFSDDFKKNIINLKKSQKGGIIVSGHIGNWEVGPKALISQGLKVSVVYRPLNNPHVEKITAKMRGISLIEKSGSGSRKIIEAIKKGEYVVILADQKISEGSLVKFFHDEALTATSIARIALKYDIDVIPARVIRLEDRHHFMIDMSKPLQQNEKNFKKDLAVINFTARINQIVESWISEFPSQWFWVHDRWKK